MSFTSEIDFINPGFGYSSLVHTGISTWLKANQKWDESNNFRSDRSNRDELNLPSLYNCPFDNIGKIHYNQVMMNLFTNGQLRGKKILILNDTDPYLSMSCYIKQSNDIDLERGLGVWSSEWKITEYEGKYCHEKFMYTSIENKTISQTELIFSSFGIQNKNYLEWNYKYFVDIIRKHDPYLVVGCGNYSPTDSTEWLSYDDIMYINSRFMRGLHISYLETVPNIKTLFLSFNRGYK